jgi:carboxymethylenebutenolidase
MTIIQPDGYLALPEIGKGPGVLVLHAWWGLNLFFNDLCNRLAREGFVAFAPDLYHGQIATTIADAERLSDQLIQEQANTDIYNAIDFLQGMPAMTSPTLAVIGFSLGAFFALDLSCQRPHDIRRVVIFYGTRPGDYAPAQAAYLGHFAESDEYEPASDVKRLEKSLRSANRPVTFYTYPGTGHWFFENDRADAYNAQAASLAWQHTVEFLRVAFPHEVGH